MRSATREFRIAPIGDRRLFAALALVVVLVLVLPGCSSTPIPQNQVDYFRSLSGTRYWTKTVMNIVVLDPMGNTVTLLGSVTSGREAYLQFKDFSVTGGTSGSPLKASLGVTGSDGGSSLPMSYIDVTAANMTTLQTALGKMEADKDRTQKLATEQAAKAAEELRKKQAAQLQLAVKDAKSLQQKGRFRDAISRLAPVRSTSVWSSEQDTLYGQLVASEVKRIVKLCRVEKDEFRNLTFIYSDRDKDSGPFHFFPYLGKDASGSWWFLHLTLYRSDWLFANQVMVKIGDVTYSTVVKDSFSDDVKTDVITGGVYESVTFRQSDAGTEALFQAIADYPGTAALKVRVNGTQYYDEYSLSSADVRAWRDLLFLSEHLNEYTFSN